MSGTRTGCGKPDQDVRKLDREVGNCIWTLETRSRRQKPILDIRNPFQVSETHLGRQNPISDAGNQLGASETNAHQNLMLDNINLIRMLGIRSRLL
jgi:hypothetical protein